MPVSTLDPIPALVVIDLQKGLAGIDAAHPMDGVVAHTAELADAFRARDLPVVLVTATGRAPGRTERGGAQSLGALPSDWADVMDELHPAPTDHRVTKQRWGAFTGTELDATLRGRGVTQIVLAGVATSAGVESTARSAHDHGYHVVLATDAMTDRDAAAHAHSTERIFPKLGETATSTEILALLARR